MLIAEVIDEKKELKKKQTLTSRSLQYEEFGIDDLLREPQPMDSKVTETITFHKVTKYTNSTNY